VKIANGQFGAAAKKATGNWQLATANQRLCNMLNFSPNCKF